jgi:8-oxo-dGTP diphosphatase
MAARRSRSNESPEPDPSGHAQHTLAVDVVAVTVVDGGLSAMLVHRTSPPQRGCPALPGVFVRPDESLEEAARRALLTKASVQGLFLEQLYTFGDPGRDPRGRIVSVTYYALSPAPALTPSDLADDTFLATLDDRGVAHSAQGEVLELAFDHAEILQVAVERLRGKLWYTPVALELAGETFTLHELQGVYEAILGRALAKPAFRRRMLASGLVEPTGDRRKGSHRPAALYRPSRQPQET